MENKKQEIQGWIAPNKTIYYIDDTDEEKNCHRTLARTLAKEFKITIPEKKDPAVFFISLNYILFCESCIICNSPLTDEEIKLLSQIFGSRTLPNVYCKSLSNDEQER